MEKYDLVIGFGGCFERVCGALKQETVSICYLTEASPYFSNIAELQRLNAFEERNGVRLPFERQNASCLNLQKLFQVNAAICLGNRWTASTYEGMFRKIYPLNVSGFSLKFLPDFEICSEEKSRNFMWYGGAGAVHKGLDLCIEAFRRLPDLKLHIVGEPGREFYDFYRKDIEEGENIYYYGFLNKDSEEFQQACEVCAFCVLPSCSEGQSTAMITAMFAGMIPVCTEQTGIDLEKGAGIRIENSEIDDLTQLFTQLSGFSVGEINERRKKSYQYVKENHTIESYRNALQKILTDIQISWNP